MPTMKGVSKTRLPRKVYAIQHNVTKRIYIGSSKEPEKRYRSHIINLKNKKHSVEDMQKDYDEYGEDFSLYIIDEINSYEEKDKEYEWMKKYNTLERGVGYNYKDNHLKRSIGKSDFIPYKEGFPEPCRKGEKNERETDETD